MATVIEIVATVLTLCGLGYLLLALVAQHSFQRARTPTATMTPDISILKPIKGVDPGLYLALASHCRQQYPGRFELLLGVASLDDPAIETVARLRVEFPDIAIHLVHCAERLGTSGKVSNLIQMLRAARYEHIVINDADIVVGPKYLARLAVCFATSPLRTTPSGSTNEPVGMVTAPYLGRTATESPTVWARLEALGISTDFIPGVLTARRLEGGIRFGLGSTLAVTRTALAAAGGLDPLTEYLADDYELGLRIARAGYRVELTTEVVETSVPQYSLSGFWAHQMRWARSTRDSRRLGYIGLGVTYALPWALATIVASGFALWSFTLLSVVLVARAAVALTVGVGLLGDVQVLRDLWLLPLRDCIGLLVWAWSYAGDTVVWRGEIFRLHRGRIEHIA
jgi:ceramide glucosyltransferase